MSEIKLEHNLLTDLLSEIQFYLEDNDLHSHVKDIKITPHGYDETYWVGLITYEKPEEE